SVNFANQMQLHRINNKEQKKFDLTIHPRRPGKIPSKGKFVLASMGGTKRQTASFYTPPKLAEFLVRRTLKPLVENKSVNEILNIRLVEPAVGSGGFLIAATRYLAKHLLDAKVKERHLDVRGKQQVSARDLQKCKRQIVEQCLYGVDINPLSIQLCRTALYLECLMEGEPLPFLHHHLKSGNSLIGAEFQSRHEVTWQSGFEFSPLFDIPFEQIDIDKTLWQAWDDSQIAYGKTPNADRLQHLFSQQKAKLALEKKGLLVEDWHTWAITKQQTVNRFLQLVKTAHEEFEEIQENSEVIDRLDDRNKDRLALLPNMDPVLIEAYDMVIDETLERKRKKALITELGKKIYANMVSHQRAYIRLKALGDLNTALWYWPLDQYQHYPSFAVYQELCDWLLNENTLVRGRRSKNLTSTALKTLKISLKTAKTHQFFHWQVEFAHIFADVKRFGFNAVISNPPWKVVGVKDKEVYPEIDPQFMSTPPAKKRQRLQTLSQVAPRAATLWLDRFHENSSLSNFWRSGKQSKIKPEGKIDLCVLFTLACEKYTKNQGRVGLIASRASLFANKATTNLRQHFFQQWGLEESISFVNSMGIFEIDSRVEFLCLIANHGGARVPARFVHGVTDPNELDSVEKNIDTLNLNHINKGHKPVQLNLEVIQQSFSREALAIPGLRDQRQLEIAQALHQASGPMIYLPQIDASVRVGLNQTASPKKGISEFAENIPPHELPSLTDIKAGKTTKWVPLYRGRQFNLFEPMVGGFNEQNFKFNQYGLREKLVGQVNFGKETLVWRAISSSSNQRTLITSSIPKGVWCDNNVWAIQFNQCDDLWRLKFLFSGLVYLSIFVLETFVYPM
ncbi:MAG: N-6 DNA methylase, partial [Gammaproteobacteria bacterium]|nr:N-6 DNA methylase [Gammaproteobacteria bacterium]